MQAVTLALAKTCLTTATAVRVVINAPITNAARATPCQNGVMGMLMIAWATIEGINDRVKA